MPEIVYGYSLKSDKTFEKLVDDDQIVINHIVLPKGADIPEHVTNSNVYLLITKGELTVDFEHKETRKYTIGQIVNVPFRVQMRLVNNADQSSEFFVIKSPNPRYIQDKM